MSEKAKFSSKIGVIAATVGSAVGLGNIWRFPAEAQENGGAAFLLVYVICVLLLGVPVMLGEFALGRGGQSDAFGVFRRFAPRTAWPVAGLLGILASYLILCFYMVVAGWTFEYLWQSISGGLYAGTGGAGRDAIEQTFSTRMEEYTAGTSGPLINTFIMIGINITILLMGVKKGIEKMSNIMMPILFLLLIVFAIVALTLPGAGDGLTFFFHPDFSKLTPGVIVNALGQAFFSLSLGMGILITYSSYYPHETKLGQTAVTVALLDLLVAVLMGIVIFPSVAAFGLQDANLRGTTLIFVTLPEVFSHMPATQLWSILFFLLLTIAALTSTISLAEVSVAFVQDRFKMRRTPATLCVMLPLFLLSGIVSLSLGSLSFLKICGLGIFDFLDTLTTNVMLPVVSLLTCLFMGWFAPKDLFLSQLSNHGTLRSRLYPTVIFIVKWLAPVLILVILVSGFIN